MKKYGVLLILFCCIFHPLLVGCGAPTKPDDILTAPSISTPQHKSKPTKAIWTWGGIYSPSHPIAQNHSVANKQLRDLSTNYLQITYTDYDTLGYSGGHGINLVREGVFAMWETIPMYLTLDSPEMNIYHLMGLCTSYAHAEAIFKATKPLRSQIYKIDHGLIIDPPYGSFSYPPQSIFTKEPLKDFQSHLNMKIRHNTTLGADQLSTLGIKASQIPWEDTYQSLKNGQVDAAITSIPAAKSNKLQEITPYYTVLPACGGYAESIFNLDAHSSIPDDTITILESVGHELSKINKDFWITDTQKGSDTSIISENVFSPSPLSKALKTELTYLLRDSIDDWAKQVGPEADKFLSIAQNLAN